MDKIRLISTVASGIVLAAASSSNAATIFHTVPTFTGTQMHESSATNAATTFGTVFNTSDMKISVFHNGDFANGFAAVSPHTAGAARLLTSITLTPQSGRFWGISFRGQDVAANQTITVTIQDKQGDAPETFSFLQAARNVDFAAISLLTTLHAKTIKWVSIQNSGGFKNFKQVNWMGSSASTPEPASWALMLLGLGGVGGALRSRRKTAQANI